MAASRLLVCTIWTPNPGGTQMALRNVSAKCRHGGHSSHAHKNRHRSCYWHARVSKKNPISIDYLTNDRDQDRATTNSKTCVLNERARIS